MARLLLISSLVARGHVGLSAMVPALTALGHDVMSLPTVVLSNHPGHRSTAGRVTPSGELSNILDALDANGWLAGTDAVLSGYLPTVEHVAFAVATVERVQARSAGSLFVCDPVLGDVPGGLYIDESVARELARRLLPIADFATPNAFELGWIAQTSCSTPVEAAAAARRLGCPNVCTTSVPYGPRQCANVFVSPSGQEILPFDRLDGVPHGTGDLFAGLLTGYLASSHDPCHAVADATADLARVAHRSAGSELLDIRPVLLDRRSMCD